MGTGRPARGAHLEPSGAVPSHGGTYGTCRDQLVSQVIVQIRAQAISKMANSLAETNAMDKLELAAFLRSRRERLRPQDVGLPVTSPRRTPGLRRDEVAALAHISSDYYVRLEQSRAPRPSAEVIAAIAGALQLTDAESNYLHILAGAAPLPAHPYRRDVRPSVVALLESLPRTAGFVISAACEVLAWNPLAVTLMEDFARLAPRDRNMAHKAFTGPDPASLCGTSDRAELQRHVVSHLRAALARYPSDQAVTGIVDELRAKSSEFTRLWKQYDVDTATMFTKSFHHPLVGKIALGCDSFTIPEFDQRLILCSASPGSPAAEALALLEVVGTGSIDARRSH